MLNKLKKHARKNRGAVLVEYVIILSFVAALAVAIGLNDDNGLKGTAAQAAADAKTNLTTALGGGTSENLQSAESRIRDVDMTEEMANYASSSTSTSSSSSSDDAAGLAISEKMRAQISSST